MFDVHEYFLDYLGRPPSARCAAATSLSSPAGQRCRTTIDLAVLMLVDARDDVRKGIVDAADQSVSAWLGVSPASRARSWPGLLAWGSAVALVALMLLWLDAGPLWSSADRQAIYIKDPPRFVEHVVLSRNGRASVVVYEKMTATKSRVVSRRDIELDQVDAECARILDAIKRRAALALATPIFARGARRRVSAIDHDRVAGR